MKEEDFFSGHGTGEDQKMAFAAQKKAANHYFDSCHLKRIENSQEKLLRLKFINALRDNPTMPEMDLMSLPGVRVADATYLLGIMSNPVHGILESWLSDGTRYYRLRTSSPKVPV